MVAPSGIVRSSFNYTVVQYLVLAIGFVKGIYVARNLTPALMGTYGLIVLVLDYLRFANLGVFSAMNLEASVHWAEKEKETYIREVIQNAFSYLVVIGGVFIVGVIVVRVLAPAFIASDLFPYLFVIAFIAAADHLKTFAIILARVSEKYHFINRIELWTNVLLFGIILLTIARYRLSAVMGAMVASSGLMVVMCLFLIPREIRFSFRASLWKHLVILGAPLLIYNMVEKVFMTIDRIFIARHLSREELGFFTLSYTILSSTMVLLSSFTFLYYPKFLKKFNLKDEEVCGTQGFLDEMHRYTRLLSYVAIGIGLVGLLLVDPFVRIFLPKYEASIFIYQILMLGILMDSTTYFAGSFLISNRRQFHLIGLLAVIAALSGGAIFLILKRGGRLEEVAVVTAFSLSLYAVGKVVLTLLRLHLFSWRNLFGFFSRSGILCLSLIPFLVWGPDRIYWVIPIFVFLFFKEHREVFRRIRMELFAERAVNS